MLSLRECWRKQEIVWGPSLKLRDPAIIEILGHAGIRSVVIDQEHATLSEESIEHLIRTSILVGVIPVVRVAENRAPLISKALDMGAMGVVVPHVTTGEDAVAAVRAAKFFPLGERGLDPTVRAGSYSFQEPDAYYQHSNDHTAIIVQIEGADGVANAADIVGTPGLDAVFIGPYDLSQSMGIPGQVRDPSLRQAMVDIVALCQEVGVVVGTFAGNMPDLEHWLGAGIRYFWYSTDNLMFASQSRAMVADVAAATRRYRDVVVITNGS